ncbi:MAG: hypothetical protein GEU90_09035 [Gemmatimonas sp.]|nr:hypothetical protein [Gemmatimonas sp.]
MIRRFAAALLAILVAVPLAAQAPAGLQMRVDESTSATDPDDVPDVTISSAEGGIEVNTGPAAVIWEPANTATGTYTLSARFTLQALSDHVNYYGLMFGGNELEADSQNYLYFLVAQDGSFLVKHRAGDETTHDIQGRTPHDAVVAADANGQSVNDLEVRVGAEQVDFVVNETVVFSAPTSAMIQTDGIYGVRINHRLPGVLVEDLQVTE